MDSKNIQPSQTPAPNPEMEIAISLARIVRLTEPTPDCEAAFISIRYEAEQALHALQTKGGVTHCA